MDLKKEILVAVPHGMCAGVRRALRAVESVLHQCGAPVYVLHEIVHNDFIVNNLRKQGVRFAETLSEVPEGAVLLFSAHGVSAAVEQEAEKRKLRIVDATCPLVKRLQVAAARYSHPGDLLILIGHRGHPEVEGVLGRTGGGRVLVVENEADIAALPDCPDARRISRLAQTTLNCESVERLTEALRRRYPALECGPGICYATTNRRHLIKETFTSREGSEIHASDTRDEAASLSDRFGLVLTYMKPTPQEYADIVLALAADRGIQLDEETIRQGANRFATRKGSRSGRVARQYVDQLESRLAMGLDAE